MDHVYLGGKGIILEEIQDGREEWDIPGRTNVFGVVNIIRNGLPNFGKRRNRDYNETIKSTETGTGIKTGGEKKTPHNEGRGIEAERGDRSEENQEHEIPRYVKGVETGMGSKG